MNAPTLTRRFELQPLLEAAARIAGRPLCPDCRPGCPDCRFGVTYSLSEFARSIGVSTTLPVTWRRRGLGVDSADRAACLLGLHPGEVWPEWWVAPDEWGPDDDD